MNYKTREFVKFLGYQRDTFHIYVKIDTSKPKGRQIIAIPARNEKFVRSLDGKAQVYISVNPCRMMANKPKISDVMYWTCEYIDLDCERPDHSIPATDAELDALEPEIARINEWLEARGFLGGYQDFTGNGYRWLLPIPALDLRTLSMTNILKINKQKHEWLKILKSETVTNIDTSVGELSRITGVPGTINVKARDSTDRRRGQFRGCDRIEDEMLRDYVMALEIAEEEYTFADVNWSGTVEQKLKAIMQVDKGVATLIDRAPLIKSGYRSEYDYAIVMKMLKWKIPLYDCIDILSQFGTLKARKRKDYVRTTVLNIYANFM